MLKTVILRFRDLVTTPGQTVDLHREIITSKGFVYWGWWNKAGEQPPDDAFRTLNEQAQSDQKLTLYLLDSGRNLLFQATCSKIDWNGSHEESISSESSHTPAYYRDTKCKAWFRLDGIMTESVDESVLHNFTYERIDNFFREGPSRFGKFYGKRIYSKNELIQQDRTIWFLREKHDHDPSHEISLLDNDSLQPCHFPKDFIQTSSTNLLWVSDLHFNNDGFHNFPIKPDQDVTRKQLGIRLESVLSSIGVTNLGGIIASGDLTWKALDTEYEMAYDFLGNISRWAALKNYQLLTCPGNHDINFSPDIINPENPPAIMAATEGTRASYEKFYQKLFYTKPNKFLSMGRKFLLGNAIPVEIAMLNSNYLEQYKKEFQGFGFLGEDQLENAAKEMGWDVEYQDDDSIPFRIVVLHHHIISVTYSDSPQFAGRYSTTLDAEAFQRWAIKHKVNLVLHGHMHQPFFTKISRPPTISSDKWHDFHIVGMGSTGVASHHLGEIARNVFGVLSFNKNSLKIRVHSVNPAVGHEDSEIFNLDIPYRR